MSGCSFTINAAERDVLLRVALEAVQGRLTLAAAELELAPDASPTAQPYASDAGRHLADVQEGIAALRALGWPNNDQEGR